MRLWAIEHRKLTCFLLGAAAVAALPPFNFFPILFISFSGLMLFLGQAQKLKEAFSSGYWFGFGFFSFGLSWIGNALLIDVQTLGWLYPIAFIASGAFFGLFSAAAAMISFAFKDFTAKYLSFAAGWTLLEWIRSFILTGFPWNLIGTTLSFDLKLLQGASIFGIYGLSLCVLLSTSAPALWLKEKNKKNFISTACLMIFPLLILYIFGMIRLHNSQISPSDYKIRIVQPSIPQNMKWNGASLENNFQEYINLSAQNGTQDLDLIVWGETASPFPLEFSDKHRQMIADILSEQTLLAAGSLRFKIQDGRRRPQNSMLLINNKGDIVASYDKSHLVPFGEYIPFRRYLPTSLRPVTNVIADFIAGDGPKTINIPSFPSFGVAICYEIIFPHKIIDSNNRPQLLLNLTNDGWYGDSAGPRQHLIATQMRAIEEGISIIRAANSGISAFINHQGKILGRLELNQKGNLDITLPQNLEEQTLYSRFGNLIPLALIIIILLVATLKNSGITLISKNKN